MKKNQQILLVGGGGHCRSVLQGLKRSGVSIVGIIEKANSEKLEVLGVPIIGTDDDLTEIVNKHKCSILITLGSIKNNEFRKNLYNKIKKLNFEFYTYISDKAIIAEDVIIGEGSVVLDGAIINSGTRIGRNCIINSGSIIEHDCIVGDHVHVASGVVMSGVVCLKDLSFVGVGAVIKQNISIGEASIVGAGVTVINDVLDNTTFVGKAKYE